MRTKHWLTIILLGIHTVVFAANLPPLPLRDKGKSPMSRMREVHIQDLRKLGIEYSVPCAFRYEDKYFGYLEDEWYYRKGKMPFQSVCYDATTKNLHKGEPVRYDADKGKWVRDSANMLNVGTEGWTEAEKRTLDRAVHFYELNAVNAQGYAYTEDDISGDEDSRMRRLHYCLIHPPKALCGDGDMGYLRNGRKGDLTHYSLQILRSIEFINDALPSTSKATPKAPATGK